MNCIMYIFIYNFDAIILRITIAITNLFKVKTPQCEQLTLQLNFAGHFQMLIP